MASTIQILFNHYVYGGNGDTGRITYDIENNVITSSTDLVSGSPTPNAKLVGPSSTPDPGTTYAWVVLYKKYENSNLYTVEARVNLGVIETRATETAYTPFTATFEQTNIVEYGRSTGEIELNILDGTGEAKSIVWQSEAASGPLGTSQTGLPAGLYTITVTDSGDGKIEELEILLTEPPCLLLIDEVQSILPSAPGASDGEITVVASSPNTLEYKLDAGTWQASNVFTGLAEGTYIVYAREAAANLCAQQSTVELVDVPCDVNITGVVVVHESFTGEGDGKITISATSARELEYTLDDRPWQDSNIFTDLAPKNYVAKARAKAANQCQSNRFAFVEAGTNIDAQITNIVCGGSATGQITAQVTNPNVQNGNAPYSYLWANGSTSAQRTALLAGVYVVTVTTSNGRSKDFSFEVTENTPLAVTAQIEEGNVFLNVSGGLAPYSFLWNDGSTAQNRNGLALGLYTVTVTDANGCKKSQTIQIRLAQHYFTDNPVALEVVAADWRSKINLSFVCECWVELDYLSGTFTKVAEKEQPAFEGEAVFRWEDVLRSYVKPSLPGEGIKRLDSNFKRFYLVYTEKHGEPPTESTFSQQETFYIHLGGLSDEVYADQAFFSEYLPTVKPFYTWQPVEKEVLPESPEYLYYLVQNANLAHFQVKATLYFAAPEEDPEEEETAVHLLYDQSGCQRWELYGFAVGYDQLNLAGYSCKLCYKYEVYVTNTAGEIISEVRTYWLNERQYVQARFFFFLNSFGCFDTLQATGKAKAQLKVDETRADLILPHDFKSTAQRSEIIEKAGAPEIQVPIGFYTKEQLERLQDFSLSSQYYLYDKPAGMLARITPIMVDVGNVLIFDEDENLQDFDFSFSLPKQKRFSPKIFAPETNTFKVFADIIMATDNQANGEIILTVEGGKAPYSYLWNSPAGGGATTQNRSGLAPGTYSVVVKDSSVPKKAVAVCGMILENNDFLAWRAKESSGYCIKE